MADKRTETSPSVNKQRSSLYLDDEALTEITRKLRLSTGHDFSRYQRDALREGIARRMGYYECETAAAYCAITKRDRQEAKRLLTCVMDGKTSFFRDEDAFAAFEQRVMGRLLEDRASGDIVRIWSPGCASGEEAYSLAILVREYLEAASSEVSVQIFATDIDSAAVAVARNGVYGNDIEAHVSQTRLNRFFVKDAQGYRVGKPIRRMVVFSEHDLLVDPPFTRMDLIVCRHLMRYFDSELQQDLIPLFHYALNPKGFLFLGQSESISSYRELFVTLDKQARLYIRNGKSETAVSFDDQVHPAGRLRRWSSVLPSMGRSGRDADPFSLRYIAEKTILQSGDTAAVLVNGDGDVLYVHGRTGRYLEPAPGNVSVCNVLKMAREGLRQRLLVALRKAVATNDTVRQSGIQVKTNGGWSSVHLVVQPTFSVPLEEGRIPMYLVMLSCPEYQASHMSAPTNGAPAEGGNEGGEIEDAGHLDSYVSELQQELDTREAFLQATTEELETSNEELRSANEELQSVNEELQSSNEELETSREELAAMNVQLQEHVADLSRANNDMRNFLAGSGVATVFVDRALRIMRFTPTATRIVALIQSDVGRYIGDIAFRFNAYDALLGDCQHVVSTLESREREVQTTAGDWFLLRIIPYRTEEDTIEGAVLTFVDISEQRRTRDALQKSEAGYRHQTTMFETLFDSIPDIVGVQDLAHRIVRYNKAGYRFLHADPSDVQGKKCYELIGRNGPCEDCATAVVYRTLQPARVERYLEDSERWLEVSAYPVFGNDGDLLQVMELLRDITDQKEAEETRQRNQRLESLGVLAGGIAHDFNNLFGGIFGSIELAGMRNTDPRVADDLSGAMGGIDRARYLTGRLMTFSKGGSPLKKQMSIVPLVNDALGFVVSGSNASYDLQVSDGVWDCEVDSHQISQAMENILINALQAMDEAGTIHVLVTNRVLEKASPCGLPAGQYVTVAVRDEGEGVPQNLQTKIFDPFFSTRIGHHGLGLSTSYSIVKRHGGCIDVESGVDGGATFSILLPAVGRSGDTTGASPAQRHRGNGLFVVMDDQEMMRKVMGNMLDAFGYTPVLLEDGQQVLEYVEEHEADVVGMLFDLTIPAGMGGRETVLRIRERDIDVPVFVASGYGDHPVLASPLEYGFTASICKPFDMDALSEMLTHFMPPVNQPDD